jgi:hypothetical protein
MNTEAISELSGVLMSLLPEVSEPALRVDVHIFPSRIFPSGIGRFIGIHPDPKGEIYGLRLNAKVLLTVKARSLNDLKTSLANVSSSLVAAERRELQRLGIFRIQLEDFGKEPLEKSGEGAETILARDLHLNVLYEYLKKPRTASGMIAEILQNIHVTVNDRHPRLLIGSNFKEGALEWFEIVDDPEATHNVPSRWQFNPEENRIEQVSAIWGGSTHPDPIKPGTYLLLKTTPDIPPLEDFILKVRLRSDDEDGIGVVFRWQNIDNFYFFLMDKLHSYRILARKVEGEFRHLSTPTLDTSQGYPTHEFHDVKIVVQGIEMSVYLNEKLVLRGEDRVATLPGRVGFMCRTNSQAYFYGIDLIQL